MEDFFYTYVLQSKVDGKNYTGYTTDLNLRFQQHNKGFVESTKNRRPLKIIYFEACLSQSDALKREKYLKTHYGKMFLKKRLKSYFTGQTEGASRVSEKDFKHFLTMSLGSSFEIEALLDISLKLGFISNDNFSDVFMKNEILQKQLNAFISKLNK